MRPALQAAYEPLQPQGRQREADLRDQQGALADREERDRVD